MKFSYNWLKEFVDIKLSPQELADLLTLKSFEVKEFYKKDDDIIFDIDILPNRPDCLSHFGLAREIGAIINHRLSAIKFRLKEEENLKIKDFLEIEIKDKELCPRYSARLITDLKVDESPKWLKEKLEVLGLRSINNVVDITNYLMLELGQPLHAFDYDKLDGNLKKKKIIVRKAKNGEKIKILDELRTEYELGENDLVIADLKRPIAIAGIKGGKDLAIDLTTKTIILESANFDRSTIQKTSKKLSLNTDASLRFSYGLDPNLTTIALDRAASLIQELASGKIAKGIFDIYSKKRFPQKISLNKNYILNLIGQEIPEEESEEILTRLGFEIKDEKGKFLVTIPTFRLDINSQEDLIEEIARIYGYERIKSKPPKIFAYSEIEETGGRMVHLEKYKETEIFDTLEEINLRDQIKEIFSSLGFFEVYNYSFISEEDKEIFNFKNLIELQNPVSYKFKYLRPNLLVNLLKTAQNNLKFYQDVRLFETGKIFKSSLPFKELKIEELKRIGGIIAKKKGEKLFFELKGIIDAFLNKFGIADHYYDDQKPFQWEEEVKAFYPGIFAEIKLNNDVLGILGEISPHILFSLNSGFAGSFRNVSVSVFELDFKKIVQAIKKEREFEPIPKYPSIVRDISILVDKEVRISEILNKIQGADFKGIVQDVDVFDIYEPEEGQENNFPENKKSIAFHIIYQAKDRTLTDKEVEEVEERIKKALEESLGAEIR